jgi:hypothetical protein
MPSMEALGLSPSKCAVYSIKHVKTNCFPMKTNQFIVFMAAGLLSGLASCQQASHLDPDTRLADEQAIRTARTEWTKAYAAKDLEKPLSFIAQEARMFPPNLPVLTGKEAIHQSLLICSPYPDLG